MTSTIRETCSCGATFEATSDMLSVASDGASRWRKEHHHAEGICDTETENP